MDATNGTDYDYIDIIMANHSAIWIVCVSLSLIFILVYIYLIVALFFFLHKSSKFKVEESRTTSEECSSENRTDSNGESSMTKCRKEKKELRQLVMFLTVCTSLHLLRGVQEQLILWLVTRSDMLCDVLAKLGIVLTSVSVHSMHAFLWYRQLLFYRNPVLQNLRSKPLAVLSKSAYPIMFVLLVANLLIYINWRSYAVLTVCRGTDIAYPASVPFSILFVSTVAIQVMLTILLVYPLIVQRRKFVANNNLKVKKGSDKLMRCILRVLKAATVSITSDAIGGLLGMFIPLNFPMYTINVLYSTNIAFNMACLIYTFKNWREIVFPFKYVR